MIAKSQISYFRPLECKIMQFYLHHPALSKFCQTSNVTNCILFSHLSSMSYYNVHTVKLLLNIFNAYLNPTHKYSCAFKTNYYRRGIFIVPQHRQIFHIYKIMKKNFSHSLSECNSPSNFPIILPQNRAVRHSIGKIMLVFS